MIASIIELREFMKEEYPEANEGEVVHYMYGYFKGIEDTRVDVLRRMKENGKNNEDRPSASGEDDKGINAGTESKDSLS